VNKGDLFSYSRWYKRLLRVYCTCTLSTNRYRVNKVIYFRIRVGTGARYVSIVLVHSTNQYGVNKGDLFSHSRWHRRPLRVYCTCTLLSNWYAYDPSPLLAVTSL
jgi:hypothetical protein